MPSLGLFFLLAATSFPQRPGPQVVTFLSATDDTNQPYSLYVPRNYDARRNYPLVVSLHEAFSNHRLNMRRLFGKGNMVGETDAEASRYFPDFRDVDFVVVSPFARGTMGYKGIAERDVFDVIADVKKRFAIDDDRIYLTGLSMGGGGALWLGLTRPSTWAAIAVVCPAVPPDTEVLASNALNLPIALFHGAQDTVVPVTVSRQWHLNLKALGAPVEYTEYPEAKHNSWNLAYRDAAIFDWFARFRRNRFPMRVSFKTGLYKYDAAYWVRITGLVPGAIASLDASFTGPNNIQVHTTGVKGFQLEPAGHPSYSPSRMATVSIDGHALRTTQLSFTLTPTGWIAAPLKLSSTAKRAGQEGPIADAVSARHIYVYGTLDNPDQAETEHRRQQAAAAADWSTSRIRLSANFRVLADRDVPAAEAASTNLVLFGTRDTNRIIARYAASLPLHLDSSAADYGLFYVWPDSGRYLLINSGRPFYSAADRVRRAGLRFLTSPVALMETLGDFALYRGSLENVIAEGRFDESWKLTHDQATRLAMVIPQSATR